MKWLTDICFYEIIFRTVCDTNMSNMCACYVPASSRPGLLKSGSFLKHRLSSQTNTSLFCALCPHSCAPRKNFSVCHPSPYFSGPSTLNLGVLWRSASEKEVATYWYEYPINPIKPWAGVSQSIGYGRGPWDKVNGELYVPVRWHSREFIGENIRVFIYNWDSF